MKSLIIPCAGYNTRLASLFFPKCLLPVHQRPIIAKIIEYWNEQVDEIIVVCNELNEYTISTYLSRYYPNSKIKTILQETPGGSFYAVRDAILHSKNDNWIINWCDVLLTEPITLDRFCVVTVDGLLQRYSFSENSVISLNSTKSLEDGVLGVYYLDSDCIDILADTQEDDLVNYIRSEEVQPLKVKLYIDTGDMQKYTPEVREASEQISRSFNSILFFDDVVIKTIRDEKLKQAEHSWYAMLKDAPFIPRHESRGQDLILEKIKGQTLHSYSNEGKPLEPVLDKLLTIVQTLHKVIPPRNADKHSSYIEFFSKTYKRLSNVEFLLDSIVLDGSYINDTYCEPPKKLLKTILPKLSDYYEDKFYFIHGDIQFSNVIIQQDYTPKIFDPRGYFGNQLLYGDASYDYAKLYYGLCGQFGSFNLGKNYVEKVSRYDWEIQPLLDIETYNKRHNLFFQKLSSVDYCNVSEEKIELLQAIIWLSVTDYIHNDVLSVLYSYLHGTLLLNQWVNKYHPSLT